MARLSCERVAVIPARSGSKGLPGKNVKSLCEKPLLVWTIESALDSRCFDKVLVTTDSPDYGRIAEEWGADVVYRNEQLSTSSATTFMVLEDLLETKVWPSEFLALLQPTSPLRTASQIVEAVDLMVSNYEHYDYVVSVSAAEHSSELVHALAPDGSLAFFDGDYSVYRRQDNVEYTPNGAIFIGKPDKYLRQKHFFGAKSLAYVMDRQSSIDIDDEIDFALAELCMRRRLNG